MINGQKIVIVRSTFPNSDSRLLKTVYFLKRSGYEPIVLAWDRDGKAEGQEHFKSFDVDFKCILFNCHTPHGRGIKNFFNILKFQRWVISQLKSMKDIFAVHACDLDCGYPANKFCKKRKINYVYDIYDLYSASRRMPSLLKSFFNNLEKKVIDDSFSTIVCTEERKEQISFSKQKNIVVVYNSPRIQSLEECKIVAPKKVLKICYIGVLTEDRLLKEILELVSDNDFLRLEIGGFGPLKDIVQNYSVKFSNIKYLGELPYSEVLCVESKSDALFAVYDPSIEGNKMSAPNKFYEALALGKPIIVCKGTGIDATVGKLNVGLSCEYTKESFLDACKQLLNNDTYLMLSENARKAYSNYSFEANMEKVSSIYSTIGR